MRELIENLILIATPALIVLFWFSSMRARERATTLARLTCKNYGAQFLDQTVSLKRIGVERNRRGQLQFRRLYSFEYSYEGAERIEATVTMHGTRSELIRLLPKIEEPVQAIPTIELVQP